ncbi:hypothetical protein AVEN_268379-1 [Araneus ventricosus]|uniref:Uncharacterized protein n=1 Tax=Araneus ventricosus TaxID=182803 RepID=A0A4Y2LN19_ARAVE|nr:hypothetical protein AVEN_268379-1 [Araneus ventricosus]
MSPLTLKKSRASKGSISKASLDRRRQERTSTILILRKDTSVLWRIQYFDLHKPRGHDDAKLSRLPPDHKILDSPLHRHILREDTWPYLSKLLYWLGKMYCRFLPLPVLFGKRAFTGVKVRDAWAWIPDIGDHFKGLGDKLRTFTDKSILQKMRPFLDISIRKENAFECTRNLRDATACRERVYMGYTRENVVDWTGNDFKFRLQELESW